MRRTPLLILSLLFIALCVTCFFYSGHSGNMHIVLIVQLVFFMHFAVTQKSGIITGEQKDNITNEPAQQKDEKYTTKATMPELHDVQQGKINSL